jgi:hypothetical protein
MNCHRARTCLRKPPQPSFKVARVIALWGLAIYLLFIFFLEKSAIRIFYLTLEITSCPRTPAGTFGRHVFLSLFDLKLIMWLIWLGNECVQLRVIDTTNDFYACIIPL